MLVGFLEKALQIGTNAIEMEYKDGKEWIMALHSNVGFGIGCLEVDEGRFFLKEMEEMKKKRQVTLTGKRYRLVFSEYESFGEWVYRIRLIRGPMLPGSRKEFKRCCRSLEHATADSSENETKRQI
jgi:hypothetical protein